MGLRLTVHGTARRLRLAAMRVSARAWDHRRVSLRCLIVDDNAAFLAAARAILEGRDLTVVGEAATAAEALQRAEELAPDIVLLDIDLGDDNGLAVARALAERAQSATPKTILMSAYPEDDFADLIAESPALGFIPKPALSPATVGELMATT